MNNEGGRREHEKIYHTYDMSYDLQRYEEHECAKRKTMIYTHLNCSDVIVALSENFLSKKTMQVVNRENKAPNPITTR